MRSCRRPPPPASWRCARLVAYRHLADPGAAAQRLVECLDEERVPVGGQAVEWDAAERLPPPAAEAARAVGDRRARDRPHVAVGRRAERDAVERPVHDADAVQVAGADHHVERPGRGDQRGQVRGAVRQVGVHLADEVGVAREHAPERVDVGPAEAPAPAAVPHGLYHCVGSGHATWFDVAAAPAGEPAERLGVQPAIRGITLGRVEPARSALPVLRAVEPQARRGGHRDAALAGRGGALRRYPAALIRRPVHLIRRVDAHPIRGRADRPPSRTR